MICLAIDSAGKNAGVALMQKDRLLYESSCSTGLTHSETLLEMADTALKACGLTPADVELYAVAAGPGSFTGLRIGLALVKGLALCRSTPCAGVSTLEALALSYCYPGVTIAALDARRGEVYWAAFKNGERLTEDTASPAADAANFAQSCGETVFFVGDGSALCYNKAEDKSRLVLPSPICRGSRAAGICAAALRQAERGELVSGADLMPRYLRLSQAERERAERIKAQPQD